MRGNEGFAAAGAFSRRCVASEYVGDPLLVMGRKVDHRVYVLATRIEPELEAFIFRDGLVRFCGEPDDLSTEGLQRLGGHINNNAVQTRTVRHASAQNWTLPQLWDFLSTTGGPSPPAVWRRIRRLVRDTLEAWPPAARAAAARREIGAWARVHCYSLLAFDLLVDGGGAAWLLDVNPKPALHAQCASLKAVFPVHFAVKAALLAGLDSLVGLLAGEICGLLRGELLLGRSVAHNAVGQDAADRGQMRGRGCS